MVSTNTRVNKGRKEVIRFGVTGIIAVLCDALVYSALLSVIHETPAKLLSFLSGTIVAYLLNTYWTFERKGSLTHIGRFLFLYSLTLLANVGVHNVVLGVTHHQVLAFFIATGVSTILNFIGQKGWVHQT